MNVLDDTIDFEAYASNRTVDPDKIKPASGWAQDVVDRFYGHGAATNWTPTGFDKMRGRFDLRPGEVTLWCGINSHGKTSYLTHTMLNVMQEGGRVCIASLEMKPAATMAKMTRQAAAVARPSIAYIRAFHRWTDGKLWLYDHVGRVEASRMHGLALYVRDKLKVDHIVIDSLMKCSLGEDDYNGQKDFVDGLCAAARDTGIAIHLVAHMRKGESERTMPNKFDVRGASAITDLVDNVVIVWKNLPKFDASEENRDASKPDAYVRIAKQRHYAWEGSFSFWFDAGAESFKEHQHDRLRWLDMAVATEQADGGHE